MTGTEAQVEWAERIRVFADSEFDRVAEALTLAAEKQSRDDADDTLRIIAVLEEKRREVLAHQDAGYFIRNWQEVTDQVRLLLQQDARYLEIRSAKKKRKLTGETANDNH